MEQRHAAERAPPAQQDISALQQRIALKRAARPNYCCGAQQVYAALNQARGLIGV
jgi:hypothetical protein